MSYQIASKLGAGVILSFENPASPGIYLPLNNALLVGQLGAQGEFVEDTPISETVRTYIRGLKTPPTKTFTFNQRPGNANFALLLTVWDDEANVDFVNMRLDYPTGDRGSFVVVPNGRVIDEPTGSSQIKQILFAQQSGATAWTEI